MKPAVIPVGLCTVALKTPSSVGVYETKTTIAIIMKMWKRSTIFHTLILSIMYPKPIAEHMTVSCEMRK